MRRYLGLDSIYFIIVLVAASSVVFFSFGLPSEKVTDPMQGAKELSYEEFLLVRDEYIELLVRDNPRIALAKLREEIKKDERLLRSCHPLVHEMGHATYEKYGNFGEAVQFQDEICNSGFMHGIIESHLGASSDIALALKSICSEYEANTFLGWACYHGAGHGAMYYASNELPAALALCDLYDTSLARKNCSNGVFMENFNTDQKTNFAPYLREDDPFYPCKEQKPHHKPDCYLYAPTYYLYLNSNDYAGALTWCKSAESGFESACVYGVGHEAMKRNIHRPLVAERLCEGGSKGQIELCIKGMVDTYINHYGSYEPAQKMCEILKDKHRDACLEVVQSSLGLFQ